MVLPGSDPAMAGEPLGKPVVRFSGRVCGLGKYLGARHRAAPPHVKPLGRETALHYDALDPRLVLERYARLVVRFRHLHPFAAH
jgi:hypothetical protein